MCKVYIMSHGWKCFKKIKLGRTEKIGGGGVGRDTVLGGKGRAQSFLGRLWENLPKERKGEENRVAGESTGEVRLLWDREQGRKVPAGQEGFDFYCGWVGELLEGFKQRNSVI